jgi:hypothetical protein
MVKYQVEIKKVRDDGGGCLGLILIIGVIYLLSKGCSGQKAIAASVRDGDGRAEIVAPAVAPPGPRSNRGCHRRSTEGQIAARPGGL